ncbi:hypothetical protein Trydic_g14392 [Trypoxylus dichotomus]
MASKKNDGETTRRGSVDSAGGTPEEECLKRVRALTGAILELVPVKSETLKIEDRKKLRGMVCELNQLFGEQNGILREVRARAEKRAPIVECIQGKSKVSYADKLKRSSVTVEVQPKVKQTSDDTKKQLAEKVDVVAKKIGVHGIKKGRDGAVFVECSSKQDAEKLRVSVAEKMQAKAREMKKSNPVVCIYGVDAALTAEQVSECVRQQNENVENAYESGEEMREDFKIFRFFATPKDNKRAVKNVVCSASPKLRSILISGKIKVMWRVCAVKDYSNVLYCFKCLKVGHKSKECKGELTCKKCAGGHDLKDCKAKEAKCAVCQHLPGAETALGGGAQTHKLLMDNYANDSFSGKGKIKCAQINLGRGRRATACLVERVIREKISIVIVQEPYVINNRICGLPANFETHYVNCDQSKPIRAAVIITDNELRGITLTDKSDNNVVCVGISNDRGLNVIVISCYLPPEVRHAGEFQANIIKLRNAFSKLSIDTNAVIMGLDANSKSALWNSPTEDWRGRELETFLENYSFVVLNNNEEPTFVGHQGSSFIDFTAVNFRAYGMTSEWSLSEDETLSDHKLIRFDINNGNNIEQRQTVKRGFCAKKADWEMFGNAFSTATAGLIEEIDNSTRTREIETIAKRINDAVITACEQSMPRQREFKKSVPWWTPQLTTLRRDANRLRRRYQRSGDDDIRREREIEYRAKYTEYKNAIRVTRIEKWREFCTKSGGKDPWGLAYRVVRRKRGNTGASVTLKRARDEYTQDARETAELLLETFFPSDDADTDDEDHVAVRASINTATLSDRDDIPFARCEINAAFKSMNAKKAPGIDGITADIAGRAYDEEPEVFEALFNKCLELGAFPRCWKKQLVRVIPKAGKTDMSDVKSYRPISLLPVIGKALDSLLINRIEYHVFANGLMSNNQYGFRRGRSTVDAIERVVGFVKNAKDESDYSAVILLDISGAFDHAWWPQIKNQLSRKNCPRNLSRMANAYFSEREAVIEEPGLIVSRQVVRGCPQGSRSGPGYWNILYDSIFELNLGEGCEIIAFADDTTLLVRARQYETLKGRANNALATILDWSRANKLTFNAGKSEALFFGKTHGQRRSKFQLGTETIHCKENVKYLGVVIDEKLNFKAHVDYATGKAREITNKIGAAAKMTWGLSGRAAATIYEGAIEPAMLYAAPVWASALRVKESRKLIGAQRVSAVRAARAYATASAEATAAISGILPADIRAKELAKRRDATRGGERIVAEIAGRNIYSRDIEVGRRLGSEIHPSEAGAFKFSKDVEGQHVRPSGIAIYTDGSKNDDGTGAAFVVYAGDEEIHSERLKLDRVCDNYQAELVAINAAVKYVKVMQVERATLFTDSLSVLQALRGMRKPTELLLQTWKLIREVNVELVWTRAHVGTQGNERADELAKEAAADADDGTLLAYAFASEKTVKSAIAKESQREWQTRWENAANGRWTKRFIGDANKFGKLGVALSYQATQLVTGHGNFGAYLHRIGRRDSADCECGGEDTAGHVLFDCPYTEDWRSRTETEAINAGLRWPRNEGEINDDETAEWWTFFCSAVEKLDRLRHDN